MDADTTLESDWRVQTTALCAQAIDMLRHAREGFASHRLDSLDAAERLGRRLHEDEHSLTERIVHPPPSTAVLYEIDRRRLFVPVHLERIGDTIELLVGSLRTVMREGIPFTDRARREVVELVDATIELLTDLRDLLLTQNKVLRQHVVDAGRALVAKADDCATFHEQRLIEGVCAPKSSSMYLSVVDALKGVEWHTREIAQKLGRVTPADVRDLSVAVEAASALARAERHQHEAAALRTTRAPVGWVP